MECSADGFFQIPGLADWLLGFNNFVGAARLLADSGKAGTFTDEDMVKYKRAWSQLAALTSMIHGYRALLRYPPRQEGDQSLHMPVLMLWGKQDIALSHEMVQPSIERCAQGKLVFFEEATHWVQHDAAEKVNARLLFFLQGESL